MKNYFKLMLGPKSKYAEECFAGNFIGVDFGIKSDLTHDLEDDWRQFNHKYIPNYLADNPGKSKIAAGLAWGALWAVAKEMKKGDIIVSPNGRGVLHFGEVISDYTFHPGEILPHRRTVQWFPAILKRAEISQEMKNSINSQGTLVRITQYAEEIERYIGGNRISPITTLDPSIEDPSEFALEKHLEDFLVQNWKQTELGRWYDIYEEEGELAGQQYPSDTGPIDILAISKDKNELLVVELKKGKASDSVVGQIQRYMGYVQEELAEDNQIVKGIIIALDDDKRIRRALSIAKNIEFYRYQVSFKLFKG